MNGRVAAVAGAVLLAAAAGAGYVLTRHSATTPAAVFTTPSGTPTLTPQRVLGEQATCVVLVPLLIDAATLVNQIVRDPNPVDLDRRKLDDTVNGLTGMLIVAPAGMVARIGDELAPLAALQGVLTGDGPAGQALNLGDFRASGLSLSRQCAKYAR